MKEEEIQQRLLLRLELRNEGEETPDNNADPFSLPVGKSRKTRAMTIATIIAPLALICGILAWRSDKTERINTLWRVAVQHYEQEEFDSAIQTYEELLTIKPTLSRC